MREVSPRAVLALVGLMALAGAAVSLSNWPLARAGPAAGASIHIVADGGVPRAESQRISSSLAVLRPRIDADFEVASQPLLTVRLYSSYRAFARAFHRLEGLWPEGRQDTSGNVVDGMLPIGPPNGYLVHNLAHIYTEWVLDRLTRNTSDRQPAPAWLYDGIAEWEAAQRAPHLPGTLPCQLHGQYPLPLSSLASPRYWWTARATIFGGLEYCEAENAAAQLVRKLGWDHIVALLHHARDWGEFARSLGVSG